MAAQTVADRGKELAADMLEANPADIVLELGAGFHVAGAPSPSLSWSDLAGRLVQDGRLEELRVEERFRAASPTFPFGAHLAVVEVDTETGGGAGTKFGAGGGA